MSTLPLDSSVAVCELQAAVIVPAAVKDSLVKGAARSAVPSATNNENSFICNIADTLTCHIFTCQQWLSGALLGL
jgi:hypothetical protein